MHFFRSKAVRVAFFFFYFCLAVTPCFGLSEADLSPSQIEDSTRADDLSATSPVSEDYSVDGLSAKASDGGSPLLGDRCSLGLAASGNSGSVRYKFVWEQGGWSRWGTIRQLGPEASCDWVPEVAGDVNILVDAVDSAGNVRTWRFPVRVDACRLSVSGGDTLEWSGGMKVNISAAAAPGAKIKFLWERGSWSKWGVIQAASESAACTWAPPSSGSYTLYADVTVGGLTSTSRLPVRISEDYSVDGLSAKASDGGSPLLGDRCSLGLAASGNSGSVRYKFVWEQGGWSRWGTIRQLGPEASCDWVPEVAGDVNILVDAVDSAGNVRTWRFPVRVDACRLSVSGGDTLEWSGGMKVNISAAAAPGAKIKFLWERGSWSKWGVIQAASESAACTWAPPSSGSYTLYADVTVGGLTSTSRLPVRISEDYSVDGLSAKASDGGSPLLGDRCSLGLAASGNSGSVRYKFVWEQGGWSRWGTIRQLGPEASCDWVPEVAGDVNILVDAVDSAGNVRTWRFPVRVERNLSNFTSIDLKSDSSNLCVGDTLSITPRITIRKNNQISYKYVWMRNNWAEWGVIDSGRGKSSIDWRVDKSGVVTVFVDVIDEANDQTMTSKTECSIGSEKWNYESLSSSATLVRPNESTEIDARCSGDINYLQYKFVWNKNNWADWGVAQQGTSSHLQWAPKDAGDYELICDVSGSDGVVQTKRTIISCWDFSRITAISTDGNNSWGVRADLGTLAAEKSGQFQFKFVWAKSDWSKWGVLKEFSSVNDAYFNPSALGLQDGYYDLYCDVLLPDGTLQSKSTQIYYSPFGSSTVLGVSRIGLVTWLTTHQFDGYYLGTRYSGGFSYDSCLYPKGAPRWDGYTGMNCTGFVAHAYAAVGGDVNRIAQNNNHSPWAGGPGGGGYINAWRWYGYARDLGCKMYEFRTVQDMLNSGYAQKGDIIFFKTDGSIDCHIGFFWGDNPHDNKMWHQILPGNLIGPCFNNANKGEVRQSVVLIK